MSCWLGDRLVVVGHLTPIFIGVRFGVLLAEPKFFRFESANLFVTPGVFRRLGRTSQFTYPTPYVWKEGEIVSNWLWRRLRRGLPV